MKVNKITKSDIINVWKEYKLGKVDKVCRIEYGGINEGFFVNDNLVIRFNSKYTKERNRFLSEKIACELLSDKDIPVPKVIVLDETRELIPYDFIILTRLKGMNIAESSKLMKDTDIENLVYDAGKTLAKIHRVTVNGYGDLCGLDNKQHLSWKDYILKRFTKYINTALTLNAIDQYLADNLTDILNSNAILLDKVKQSSIVHADYHYENILHYNGELSGVLDFEHSISGDPTYDFFVNMERERVLPDSEKLFLKGYTSIRTPDNEHNKRLDLYNLFRNHLDSLNMYTEDNMPERAGREYNKIISLMEKLAK